MAELTEGGVYLVQEREFINSRQQVYKLGRTECIKKRMGGYPKGSKCLYFRACANQVAVEGQLVKLFTEKFKHRGDIGRESFEGDPAIMIDTINDYLRAPREMPVQKIYIEETLNILRVRVLHRSRISAEERKRSLSNGPPAGIDGDEFYEICERINEEGMSFDFMCIEPFFKKFEITGNKYDYTPLESITKLFPISSRYIRLLVKLCAQWARRGYGKRYVIIDDKIVEVVAGMVYKHYPMSGVTRPLRECKTFIIEKILNFGVGQMMTYICEKMGYEITGSTENFIFIDEFIADSLLLYPHLKENPVDIHRSVSYLMVMAAMRNEDISFNNDAIMKWTDQTDPIVVGVRKNNVKSWPKVTVTLELLNGINVRYRQEFNGKYLDLLQGKFKLMTNNEIPLQYVDGNKILKLQKICDFICDNYHQSNVYISTDELKHRVEDRSKGIGEYVPEGEAVISILLLGIKFEVIDDEGLNAFLFINSSPKRLPRSSNPWYVPLIIPYRDPPRLLDVDNLH